MQDLGAPVGLRECPIAAAAGFFSRKWMLLVLRDVACHGRSRFRDFLEANPGLTDKVLSRRLRELLDEGLLERTGRAKAVRYRLSEKGRAALPILAAYYSYGIRNRPAAVFADGRPRRLAEVRPAWDAGFLADAFGLAAPAAPADAPGAWPNA